MAFRTLRAGSLEVEYDEGTLRAIRAHGREVLRQICFAVRDRDWGTVPARISEETVDRRVDGFSIGFLATHRNGDVAFAWRGLIEASGDCLRFEANGQPQQPFLRNRIGFCVLHPLAECAGRSCIVEHTNGTRETTAFPREISPHQPFVDVRAIAHEAAPGLQAEVTMSGDVFETEDHRNWSDASFKTYSTPLSLPRPVEVGPGDLIAQSVELVLRRTAPRIAIDGTRRFRLPELGTRRVDVTFVNGTPVVTGEPGARTEVAIFSDHPENQVPKAISALRTIEPVRWLIFNADGTESAREAIAAARALLPRDAVIGGGTNCNFAELNRNRSGVNEMDFLSWGIDPTIHAMDARTIIENLEGQGPTVRTAASFAAGKPLHISPLRVPDTPARDGWLAMSIATLAEAGAACIVCGKASALIDELALLNADALAAAVGTHPRQVGALAAVKGDSLHIWLANLTDSTQNVNYGEEEIDLAPCELRRVERRLG